MTKNSAAKKAARARAKTTGEKYTVARRATAAKRLDGTRDRGTLTLVIDGGGAGNLALVIDALADLLAAGHPLISFDHAPERGIEALSSPLDFAVARGAATVDEIRAARATDDETAIARFIEEGFRNVLTMPGRMTSSTLDRELRRVQGNGPAPVLWVQDVQVDSPLADRPDDMDRSVRDNVPSQLEGLREIARNTGAIVVAGHCIPGEYEDAWRDASLEADRTYVATIPDWDAPAEVLNGPVRPQKLRLIERGGTDTTELTTEDLSFHRWRR